MTAVRTEQRGYLLVGVAMLLAVVAALALIANPASIVSSMRITGETEALKLDYVVEAGMEHALWQADNANCGPYIDIPPTPFGTSSYFASFSPGTGSPVSVAATGTLANGIDKTLTLDRRIFQPITTTTLRLDATTGQDTYLREGNPGSNYGAATLLDTRAGGGDEHRSLLRFQLDPLPTGSRLISATLQLHANLIATGGQIGVHRLTQGWSESGSSWNERDGGEPWSGTGGDFDPVAMATASVAGAGGQWVAWDITALFADWSSGAALNNGVILVAQDSPLTVSFVGSEHSDSSLHPQLVLTYACECGVGGSSGSIELQPGTSGKDTQIHEDLANDNFGSSPQLLTDAESSGPVRSLLQFDLSAVPAGVQVTSATLDLFLSDNSGPTDSDVEAHRMLRDWAEGTGASGSGATWNSYDGVNTWTTPGGDYASEVAGSFFSAGTGWKTMDIAGLVQQWVDGSEPNYGLVLLSASSSGNNPKVYESSDSPDSALRPRLTVSFVCPCGVECGAGGGGEGSYCDADFTANAKRFDFDWGSGTGNLTGIDYLPEGTVVDGTTIPAGGGWIMTDDSKDKIFVVDQDGASLTDFPIPFDGVRGVALIESGVWAGHLAVASKNNEAIYFMDLNGAVVGNFPTTAITEEPFGLSFVGETASGVYEDHLAISSSKNSLGNGNGTVFIVDQNGVLRKTIDVDSFAEKPQGIAHLAGDNKLMVADLDGVVSIMDFDGTVTNQYNVIAWGYKKLQGITLHPLTCDHVVIDKDTENVGGLTIRADTAFGDPRLLMVVADPADLTAAEQAKKSKFEYWGYVITLIDDHANGGEFDTAAGSSDVVFVGEDISATNLDDKLADAPIGVVLEEVNLSDEFGLSTTVGWSSGAALDIDDNSHYITAPFSLGPLDVLEADSDLASVTGTLAPGLGLLGSTASGPAIVALEAGATMFDTLPAAGRRVQLPWGGSNFDPASLTTDAETILWRSLVWATRPPNRCDPDYAANNLVGEFPWMTGTGNLHGIDYIRDGLVVNGVTIPDGGGWIMSDNNKDRLFVTDLGGNSLTDLPIFPTGSQGVAMIDFGNWMHHIAVADTDTKRVYYLDRDGGIAWSFPIDDFNQNPLDIAFVGETASGLYDGHFVLSSDKDMSGGGTATLTIVDQSGNLVHVIDIEAFAPTPRGVTHLAGYDKLMIADKNGVVSIVDFDGTLLRQYWTSDFGLTELNAITINPMTCEHVILDKDFEKIGILDPNAGGGGAGARYLEMNLPLIATTEDAWETRNLGIYGVPANGVVEVAIVNEDGGKELWGGVREVGSTLQRRLKLHEAGGGGVDAISMHVQADSQGRIQHYSDDEDKLGFVLLGYWTESAYVEQWQTFKAGASGSWQPHALSGYGVGTGEVAEILLVNNDGFSERMAGVRSNGSSLNRQVDLHEAMDGGSEAATVFTVAGSDAGATVNLYAEADASIDFNLLGYWSTPPGIYSEAIDDLGTASVDEVWQDADLGSAGVPANVVVQIAAVNKQVDSKGFLGVRSVGSLLPRFLQIHKSENGGEDLATMHVNADNDSAIQWYDEDVFDDHRFYLLGWWVLP